MEKSTKYYALTGTLLVHVGLLLFLMYTFLTTPTPPMGSGEAVLVNIGYAEAGSGDEQPMSEVIDEDPALNTPQPPEQEINEAPPLTSEIEESIKIEEKKEKKEIKKKEKIEKPKEVEKEPVKETPKEPEKKVNVNAIYKGSKNNSKSEGDDKAGTPGDKGVKDGGPNSNVYTGASGNGKGGDGEPGSGGIEKRIRYTIEGRKLLESPIIKDKSDETGKVVVSITVDKNGKVIKARAGARGSTINNSALYKSSEEASLKAKFDAPEDSPEEQHGTITFIFQLK